jgi:hypothetical protein
VVVHHMFGAGTSTPETTEEFERRYDAKGDTQEWMLVTTTINNLLTLASLGPIGPNLECQTLTKLPAADTERAYRWISNNWKGCNSLLSKRSAAMLALPGIGDQKAWIKYSANVIKKQMGVSFRVIRGSTHLTYKVLPGVLFQRLGTDMPSYAAWLRTEGPNNHTTSPTLWASCEQCTQLGVYAPPVQCVFQNGLARCVVAPSNEHLEHRDMKMPLDVGTMDSFTKRVASMMGQGSAVQSIDMVEEEEEEKESKVDAGLIDRVLMFMGFTDGIRTAEQVGISKMLLVIKAQQPLAVDDELYMRKKCNVSFTNAKEWNNASKLGAVFNKLSVGVQVTIRSKMLIRNTAESRVYYLER